MKIPAPALLFLLVLLNFTKVVLEGLEPFCRVQYRGSEVLGCGTTAPRRIKKDGQLIDDRAGIGPRAWSHQLRRSRLFALSPPLLREFHGLFPRIARQTSHRDCLHR